MCDGGKTPLGGEDLAVCDVTVGRWTEPTLVCTGREHTGARWEYTGDIATFMPFYFLVVCMVLS